LGLKLFVAAAGLFAISTATQASVVFFDTFDPYTPMSQWTGANGWTTGSGTVDLVMSGTNHIACLDVGNCVVLDGSNYHIGVLAHSLQLTANTTYTLSFELGGNQQNSANDKVTVHFGSASLTVTVPGSAGFTSDTLAFTPSSSGTYSFSFQGNSISTIGALLEDVKVSNPSQVPLPAAGWLLMSGLGALGVFARKRGANPGPI
jgi:hypothetical protein